MLCSGFDNSGQRAAAYDPSDCFSYEGSSWQALPWHRLHKSSQSGAFAFNPNRTGFGRALAVTGDVIDVLTTDGWQTLDVKLPFKVYFGCATAVDSSTFMIFQGFKDTTFTSASDAGYFFNIDTKTFTAAPPLHQPRARFQCSRIGNSFGWNVVVAGGVHDGVVLNHTELYVRNPGYWTKLRDLPVPIADGFMLPHPDSNGGGVVLAGGRNSSEPDIANLYTLQNSKWFQLAQTLAVPRAQHVAFMVPDDIVNCVVKK